jgi:hypothetical protein
LLRNDSDLNDWFRLIGPPAGVFPAVRDDHRVQLLQEVSGDSDEKPGPEIGMKPEDSPLTLDHSIENDRVVSRT